MNPEIQIAIIAALAAIFGAVASQLTTFLISYFDKKHQKKVHQRLKYEELLFEFQNSFTYIQNVSNCKTLPKLYQLSSSPQAGKAHGLALLYFPNLVEPLAAYITSQYFFYNSIITKFDRSIAVNAGGQAIKSPEHLEIIKNLKTDKKNVMDALISNANKYTEA